VPQTTEWYLENRIIIAHYSGAVTLADLRGSCQRELELLDASTAQYVDVLVDITEQTSREGSLMEVRNIFQSVMAHPKKRWTILFGPAYPQSYINDVVARSYRARYRSMDTLTEALDFLKKQDPTLHKLLVNGK